MSHDDERLLRLGESASDDLLGVAEATSVHEALSQGEEIVQTDRYVLFFGIGDTPRNNVLQRLRLAADALDHTLEEVRALARERGRRSLCWEVAGVATPPDLASRLVERGLLPHDPPKADIMVLRASSPAPVSGVVVTRVGTLEHYREFVAIGREVFEMTDDPSEELARIDREWARDLASPDVVRYLAWIGGAPVAAARATFTAAGALLSSGATRPVARGKGAYRALVAARWEDAVRRGTPALVTRAGAMSRPILRRLGFEERAEIRFLVDDLGGTP